MNQTEKQGPTKARRLRELIARRVVMLPGAFNALTAMQIERAGFDAAYVSGASLAAARGLPDIGLLSMAEVVSDAKTIASAVAIPALADADTGYGAPLTVARTVREFERAGLAGVHLEDQKDPKKCGHLSGKSLVPMTEMARKIGAAVEARRDPDCLIVARTDARAMSAEPVDGVRRRFRSLGTDRKLLEQMQTRQQLYDLLQYEDYEKRDKDWYERYGREPKD